jgi:hypothetical protein
MIAPKLRRRCLCHQHNQSPEIPDQKNLDRGNKRLKKGRKAKYRFERAQIVTQKGQKRARWTIANWVGLIGINQSFKKSKHSRAEYCGYAFLQTK